MREVKGNFTIDLNIKCEEDLYNELDDTHNTLNNNIISYIEDNLTEKKITDRLVIKIKPNSNIDEKQVKVAFCKYINDRIELNRVIKKRNKIRQTRLFIIGLIFIILSIIVGKVLDNILYTIISTIGSFAIWEAANI